MNNMNVPILRFSGCSEPWEATTIGKLVKQNILEKPLDGNHGNIHPKASDYVDAGIPFLMASDIQQGKADLVGCKFITKQLADSLQKGFAKEGDVLLTHKGTVGETTILEYIKTPYVMLTPQVTYYRVKDSEKLDNRFLEKVFISNPFRRELLIKADSGTRPYIGILAQLTLNLSYPSLPEQRKIASFLSKVDEKITLLIEKKEKLTEYKKGVMQQLFNGKWEEQDGQLTFIPPTMRFKTDEGSEFPDWEASTLGNIGKVKMCKRIMAHQTADSGDIPFYKIGTFGKEADAFISEELYKEYRKKYSFPNVGDILMSASGTLGRTVIYDGSPSYFQDSNIVWIENDGSYTSNEFLYYVYQIVKYQSEGGTIQRLYNNIISSAKFNNPSIAEQKKIVAFLSAIDEKIDLTISELDKANKWKKGLLQQMFV